MNPQMAGYGQYPQQGWPQPGILPAAPLGPPMNGGGQQAQHLANQMQSMGLSGGPPKVGGPPPAMGALPPSAAGLGAGSYPQPVPQQQQPQQPSQLQQGPPPGMVNGPPGNVNAGSAGVGRPPLAHATNYGQTNGHQMSAPSPTSAPAQYGASLPPMPSAGGPPRPGQPFQSQQQPPYPGGPPANAGYTQQ
ncbi:proline-rich protein 2-like, partial [Anopheles bellator]|uniref:proline-rich protein 2-like n=1 Tax=Anopheles bellator TaxID=139047 RepID=UPI002649600C